MKPDRLITLGFLLVILTGSAAVCAAAEPDGSGESYWGEIAPENEQNTARSVDNRRPLWENLIYYPYEVAVWPVRTVSHGIGYTISWASNPKVYRPITDFVTLSFVPVEGKVGVMGGGGDGFGITYSLTHKSFFGPDNRMKLGLGYSTESKSKATLGLLFGEGRPGTLSFGVGYRLKPNTRYFGLGYDSPETTESYFTNETAWFGTSYRRQLGGATSLEAGGMYSTAATRGTANKIRESLERIFPSPADHPVGFGDQSDGYIFKLGLLNDTATESGRPHVGGLRRAQVSWFTSDDDTDVEFWSERLELQQFLPLWHTRRTLALRGFYTRLHSRGNDPIPFQRLLTNDDPDQFRGFRDDRFRDEGLVAFSAEYRFPTWNYRDIDGLGLDAYLFADYGQVFAESREIALRNLSESFGGGFRFLTAGGFSGRLEIGFSDEDTVIRMSAAQTFQYAKGGLFHGRNPIPSR